MQKLNRHQYGRASSGEVTPEAAVVRLGQDAVRGEHCGEGIAGAELLEDLTAVMQNTLRGKIELSSDAKKVSRLP